MQPDRIARNEMEVDLTTSDQLSHASLETAPKDNLDAAEASFLDGILYHYTYQEFGGIAVLEVAIQQFEESVGAAPLESPDRADRLYHLANAYRDRCSETGAIKDLEAAIRRFQEAFKATPDDHPRRAVYLHGLGLGYYDRYGWTGVIADLETALRWFEEALKSPSDEDLTLAEQLHSLGLGYRCKFRRTNAVFDIEMAIQRLDEALKASLDNDPRRADQLHSLGVAHRDKYTRFRDPADSEMAVQRFREAVEASSDDSPDRAAWLNSLGDGYFDTYERTKTLSDLEFAIQRLQQALELTPDDHPDRAARMHSLGAALIARAQATGSKEDVSKAIQWYELAAETTSSPPIDRLRTAIGLLRIYSISQIWSEACLAASLGASLIPLVTPRFLENADKQHLLIEINGFASDGAAALLMAGKPAYEAIEFLELARGIIFGASSELRADISDLRRSHPQLAEEYDRLRSQLDVPTNSTYHLDQTGTSTLRSDQRYTAGHEIVGLIDKIRNMPGFDRFLLPPSEEEMKANAAPGPIVVINTSFLRCDALLIIANDVKTVQLPRLRLRDIQERTKSLDAQLIDVQLLEWLWETIAEPVLKMLDYCETPQEKWPRIWWVPTGPLTRFPIHAAGYHSEGTGTVLDRTISSYSSSVGSLIRSRQNITKNTENLKDPETVVLVGMPELLHAPQEIDELRSLCNAANLRVREPQSLQKDVLAALGDCDIFHFAGHGRTDPLDPSQSALVLSDGELTVSRLFEMNMHRKTPFLAYLSACGTGQVKYNALVDESLHLIAACQLAGFQHVVGTLWEVHDQSCVGVATETYRRMQHQHNIAAASVSEGLHHACRTLRRQWIEEQAVRARARQRGFAAPRVDGGVEETPRSRFSNEEATQTRTIIPCDDLPLHWVPYVHYGV